MLYLFFLFRVPLSLTLFFLSVFHSLLFSILFSYLFKSLFLSFFSYLSLHSTRLCTRHRTQLIYHLQVPLSPFLSSPHSTTLPCRLPSFLCLLFLCCLSLRLRRAPFSVLCYLSALYCQNALSKQMLNNFSAPQRQTQLSRCLSQSVSLSLSLCYLYAHLCL